MQSELSIPVIWTEDGTPALAGRLDVLRDHLHFEGGVRERRRSVDLPFREIATARMGRATDERVNGRPAIVLALAGGGSVAFAGFGRPGALVEILHQIEERL
ncbi:MAG: hypothetical protein ABUS54_13695 [Actinomycetota bacterium]